jgi:LysR family glycine cleavage system transcriptional activator
MARRLPSLNQLRAFEAAARHGSFKGAAEELCVTQAAISHQVKGLEDDLGQALFHRGTREVRLTRRAAPLAQQLTRSLDDVTVAVELFTGRAMTGCLRLSVAPFFGNRWLLPRLERFRSRCPGIEIDTVMSFDLVDLAANGFDGAVRYGAGDWPGLSSLPIYQDCVGPVVAPQRVVDHAMPMSPDEIARLPLATASNWRGDWDAWFGAAGLDRSVPLNTVDFDSRPFAFDAALSGQAVAIFDSRMTAADEANGHLVRLHPLTVERPQGIHVVFPKTRHPDPRIEAFAAWLQDEANLSGTASSR